MPHTTQTAARARARRRGSALSRRDELWQLLTLVFFALVISAFTAAAAAPVLP